MRLIDADAFKDYFWNAYEKVKHTYPDGGEWARQITEDLCKDIDEQPTIDISNTSNTLGALDCVSREELTKRIEAYFDGLPIQVHYDMLALAQKLPSAQPERTCVNCGRTVNNGGWYADGGTRCPIEEHYALPKDGYCHLWEKRNVTDDDYPERRTNNANIDT